MAILNELRALSFVILRALGDFFAEYGFNIARFARTILLTFFIIVAVVVGYFGYSWYVVAREQNAHQAIADYMRDYQMALRANTPQAWQRLDGLLSIGYTHHKKSYLAPFFLMLRADTLIRQQNMIEAVQVLEEAITALPSHSPLMPLFKTKRALLLVDNNDETVQKEGLQQLLTLARDKSNAYNDLALFYLGRYYWAHDEIDNAKKTWQELVENGTREKAYPSPWAKEAQNALKQIVD